MSELVSIIIPAYNVERYIHRAIESSISQSHREIEVVIIDDGSTDGTWNQICRYAKIDNRIKIFHQNNAGVSVARNRALSIATGDYVIFLDADDWIEIDCIDNLLGFINDFDDCLICCDRYFVFIEENGEIRKERQIDKRELEFVSIDMALKTIGSGEYNLQSSCYKLFKKKIIDEKQISFDIDIYHGEDGLFVFKYLLNCKGILFSDEPLWNILQRNGSATRSAYNNKWLTMVEGVNRMIKIALESAVVDKDLILHLYNYKIKRIELLLSVLSDVSFCKKDYIYLRNECDEIINHNIHELLIGKKKIELFIISQCPVKLVRLLIKLYKARRRFI